MSEKTEQGTPIEAPMPKEKKVEKPKVKEFFNRKYSNGETTLVFNLRKARPFELRAANQKFNDIADSLSDEEKEDAETRIIAEILTSFDKDESTKANGKPNNDDVWILRDCWLDFQSAHNSTVSFL